MSKHYVLIEVDDPDDDSLLYYPSHVAVGARTQLPRRCTVRRADVTDLLTYKATTPNDPWDKPYPAMYENMIEKLQ